MIAVGINKRDSDGVRGGGKDHEISKADYHLKRAAAAKK